ELAAFLAPFEVEPERQDAEARLFVLHELDRRFLFVEVSRLERLRVETGLLGHVFGEGLHDVLRRLLISRLARVAEDEVLGRGGGRRQGAEAEAREERDDDRSPKKPARRSKRTRRSKGARNPRRAHRRNSPQGAAGYRAASGESTTRSTMNRASCALAFRV